MIKNQYCIAIIYNNFKIYYNFKNNSFDLNCYKHNRKKDNFILNVYDAKNIALNLHKLEQKKVYPFAKNVYLYENDNLISYI